MAYQHFYSRVPARISLYNKTDGFDTFAHSSELTDDFIRKGLLPIYDNKFYKNDPVKIRKGEIPPVYSQCVLGNGNVVQSALTYIPMDYTGERSSYLVHSLVLNDEERRNLYFSNDSSVFNSEMFVTDISTFNVTAPNAAPNRNYPARDYVAKSVPDVKRVISRYNSEIMKSFLYAVILAVCGKGKSIFFRLPVDDKRISAEALKFINTVMTVLPYSFREALSFVTYVSDVSQYPSFKLKCVSADCTDIPSAKGVFFDFEANLMKGISEEELNSAKPLTTFFYSLFENVGVRERFHSFILRVTETYQSKPLNLKMLNEIVFLFWQCSGFYMEKSVLPSDAMVNEFFTIYEKYRDALDEGYRAQAYKCLERYPREHLPIPKNIFAKLQRIYPTDDIGARRVALTVVLDLIHTDVMREKLFDFIKSNYDSEPDDVRALINDDLCRVFYGGFLQNDILDFFDSNFDSEPEKTQVMIVEKMLLAIRTVAIQAKIVDILDRHYGVLVQNLRLKIYSTFFEMLAECDGLSALLVGLVNDNIDDESDELKAAVASKIAEILDADYRQVEHRLLPILVSGGGFCEDVAIRLIFTSWNLRPIYREYVGLLTGDSVRNKVLKLIHVFAVVPDIRLEIYEKLLVDSKAAFGTEVLANMYELMDADRAAAGILTPPSLERLRTLVLYPALVESIFDVFQVRYGKDGIPRLMGFAKGIPQITGSNQFKAVEEYVRLVECARDEDTSGVFRSLIKLPTSAKVRRDIADHVRMCSLNKNVQSAKTALIFELCINALKDSNFRFDMVFTQCRNSITLEKNIQLGAKSNPERVAKESAAEAMNTVVELAVEICYAHPDYIDLVCSEESGIVKAMQSFLVNYGSGAAKHLQSILQNAPTELSELASYTIKENRSQNQGFFGRLFRR